MLIQSSTSQAGERKEGMRVESSKECEQLLISNCPANIIECEFWVCIQMNGEDAPP